MYGGRSWNGTFSGTQASFGKQAKSFCQRFKNVLFDGSFQLTELSSQYIDLIEQFRDLFSGGIPDRGFQPSAQAVECLENGVNQLDPGLAEVSKKWTRNQRQNRRHGNHGPLDRCQKVYANRGNSSISVTEVDGPFVSPTFLTVLAVAPGPPTP